MRNLLLLSALCMGVSSVGHADTTFFLANNTYESGGTATGSVNIDTAAGLFDSVNVTVNELGTTYLFTGAPVTQTGFGSNGQFQYYEYSFDSGGNILLLDVPVASLTGYTGGNLCSLSNLCGDGQNGVFAGYFGLSDGVTDFAAQTGSLNPTPEPSSVIMLGTGLLAGVGVARRRLFSRGA